MREELSVAVIKRAQTGDNAALTALYEFYRPDVYQYLYYRLGRPQLAEDLMTEVFIRVIEHFPRYQLRSVPFRAWLLQIARNLAIDHMRKMNVRDHVDLDEKMPADIDGPETAVDLNLTGEHLKNALRRLTADQCDVIVLRFVAEMPITQVAQSLNKSESAVKALQARGLEALQKILVLEKVYYDESK
jgi:RNA polymerase sigma-70 factor (ECF subfamily)